MKRYAWCENAAGSYEDEQEDGEWCKYEDVAYLFDLVARLEAVREKADQFVASVLHAYGDEIHLGSKPYRELRDALAVCPACQPAPVCHHYDGVDMVRPSGPCPYCPPAPKEEP